MELLQIINNLYTNKESKWIQDIDEKDIEPYVIQRMLLHNEKMYLQTRWLDNYVFKLPSKMYLSLAWSIIPKSDKMPFIKYIEKKEKEEHKLQFIFNKIRKYWKLSDNDFNSLKGRLEKMIYKDMINWFTYFGIEKHYWELFSLDFRIMKGNIQPKNKWGF